MLEVAITSPSGQALRKMELSGEERVLIGRAADCDIRLNSPVVSRHHAEIIAEDEGEWVLRDLGSTHGCFVDGQRVSTIEISAGMVVRIGPAKLRFENLASRIGKELDELLGEDDDEAGPIQVEIIGRDGHHKVSTHDDTAR